MTESTEGYHDALSAERLRRWRELEQRVNELADKLGLGIDEGIKETVVALQAHGLETAQSCEGHDDRGQALPYVLVEAEEPDGWQNNEKLKRQWRAENERLAERLADLVEQWYTARAERGETVDPEARLEPHPQGIFGAVRLEPRSQERMTRLSPERRVASAGPYREEMHHFSAFLHERFLSGF